MSTLFVDTINEKTTGNGIYIPGHVLQVVSASFPTEKTDLTNNGSYADTHITADITPSSTSSKILVLINTVVSVDATNTNFRNLRLGKDGTSISDTLKVIRSSYQSTAGADVQDFSLNYLDSPSSTSSITYSLMGDAAGQGMAVGGRMSNTGADGFSSIVLMEIGG